MNIHFWSDSVIPSISANSIQVMKMANAFSLLGNNLTLHAKRATAKDNYSYDDLDSLYGITQQFKVHTHTSHTTIKHIDYDIKVLFDVIKSKPDLVFSRSLRGSFLSHLFKQKHILELHYLPSTLSNRKMLYELSTSPYLHKIIVISNGLRKLLLNKYPYLSNVIIKVCHDGIDIERFAEYSITSDKAKQKFGIDQKTKIVMYVGHLYEGRGIDLIEQLSQELPYIKFVIIGGKFNDLQYRKTRSTELKLTNLHYWGFIPNSELQDYYQLADVLIMPYENKVTVSGGGDTVQWMSPMKTFEYLASGKPVISSDLPALREVLNDNNAVLVEADNLEHWKNSILNTLTNSKMTTTMCQNARITAESNTWQARASQILDGIIT